MCPPSPRALKSDMGDHNHRNQSTNVAPEFGQGQRIIAYAESEKKKRLQQVGVIPEFILKKESCVVLVGQTAQAQTVRKNVRFRHTYD